MISMQTAIPEIWDIKDENMMRAWMIAVKLYVEELARKAQQVQEIYQAVAPVTTDFPSENSVILYDDGVNRRAYYLVNGSLRYATLT